VRGRSPQTPSKKNFVYSVWINRNAIKHLLAKTSSKTSSGHLGQANYSARKPLDSEILGEPGKCTVLLDPLSDGMGFAVPQELVLLAAFPCLTTLHKTIDLPSIVSGLWIVASM